MIECPQVTDEVWNELPEGMVLITDGDDVVGFAFEDDADIPLDEINDLLAKIGMPPLEPPD